MNAVINLIAGLLPELIKYFSKNRGLNTVTGGFLGAFTVLLAQSLQNTATVDDVITFLQNQGETGLVAGAFVAALRVFVLTYNASKGK